MPGLDEPDLVLDLSLLPARCRRANDCIDEVVEIDRLRGTAVVTVARRLRNI